MAAQYSNLFIAASIGALAFACASDQTEAQQPQQPQQPYPAQQYPQQPAQPGQAYPAQPAQPYPAQPGQPAQPYPAQPAQPYPAQPAPAQPYPPATAPGAPAPGTPPVAAPPGVLAAPAAAGSLATPIDPGAASAVQPLVVQLAGTKAPAGAKPVGALMAANFQTGQQLQAQVQMEPGRCYTVVAAGLPPGVTEIDIQLIAVTPMAGMAPVLAVDNTTGPQAVLGEKPNCYKWAWPIPAPVKVVVTAKGGAGLGAAQVFAK